VTSTQQYKIVVMDKKIIETNIDIQPFLVFFSPSGKQNVCLKSYKVVKTEFNLGYNNILELRS
jgi:hypothetical protein